MRVERSGPQEVSIFENIKTMGDYLTIRSMVTQIVEKGVQELHLRISDSISMPSSVIGLLLKLKNQDKIRIRITIGDQRLYELLDEMNLVDELGAKVGS